MKTCPTKHTRRRRVGCLDSVGQTELADKLLGSQRVIMIRHKTETKPHDSGEQTNRCLFINDRLVAIGTGKPMCESKTEPSRSA